MDYSKIRGLLTLSTAPTVEQFKSLGFNVVLPFKTSPAVPLGKAGISMIGNGAGGAWLPGVQCLEAECSLIGYFMADEPKNRGISADAIISWINNCRSGTSLPITCTFAADNMHQWPGWGYDRVIPYLDFVCITCYFYRGGGFRQVDYNYGVYAINFAHNLGKPVVGIAQGCEEPAYGTSKPDIAFVDNFWRSRNCGVIWYAWNAGAASIGNRAGDAWYNEEIRRIHEPFIETFTEKTVTCSVCGSTLKITTSSIAENNITQTCPVCATGIEAAYSVAVISEEPWPPPTYTKETKICSQCASELELTISSAPEENVPQSCPVCGASIGEGTGVAIITEQPWPPIAEIPSWIKKYWALLLAGAMIATGAVAGLVSRGKKK